MNRAETTPGMPVERALAGSRSARDPGLLAVELLGRNDAPVAQGRRAWPAGPPGLLNPRPPGHTGGTPAAERARPAPHAHAFCRRERSGTPGPRSAGGARRRRITGPWPSRVMAAEQVDKHRRRRGCRGRLGRVIAVARTVTVTTTARDTSHPNTSSCDLGLMAYHVQVRLNDHASMTCPAPVVELGQARPRGNIDAPGWPRPNSHSRAEVQEYLLATMAAAASRMEATARIQKRSQQHCRPWPPTASTRS